jgi:hypothetical protein
MERERRGRENELRWDEFGGKRGRENEIEGKGSDVCGGEKKKEEGNRKEEKRKGKTKEGEKIGKMNYLNF